YWGSADPGPLRAHDRAVALALRAYFGQMPDEPRRCESSKWVSTMPTASINAYIVVGPTKVNPSLRSALDSAKDSADLVRTSALRRGCGVSSGGKDRMNFASPPFSRSLMVASALLRVAASFF